MKTPHQRQNGKIYFSRFALRAYRQDRMIVIFVTLEIVDNFLDSTQKKLPLKITRFLNGLFFSLLLMGCNPYLTRSINHISKEDKEDTIYVEYPIVEARRAPDRKSFYSDNDALQPAEELTKKALHQLLDSRLPLKYKEANNINSLEVKKMVDSVLDKFLATKYAHFRVDQKSVPREANLILISYLIWTRSTPEFESDQCGLDGKIYMLQRYCTWTRAQAYLFLIDGKSREVVYFKYNQWDTGNIYLPFEKRVTRSFKRCSQALLRKIG